MNSHQIANLLAYYSFYHPKDDVNVLASLIKMPPALVVNAIYEGQRSKLFDTTRDGAGFKRIIVKAPPALDADFGDELRIVTDRIVETLTNLNQDGQDITDDNLLIWLGVPPLLADVAIHTLFKGGHIGKYVITDSKDRKSKYTFYTLRDNQVEHYGIKQFKKTPPKKDIIDVVLS